MRFYQRKRRNPPAVIIVALIDVLIVVLIFLLVTTTFKKPQPALRLALPESSQASKAGASENPPLELVIEQNGTFRLGPDRRVIPADRLKAELVAAATKNPQLKLALNADKSTPFENVIRVMDASKEAGIKLVNASVRQAGQK